ncbi:MAG: pirin family protein [Candidatus Poseidoniaceae archaeon]|nr:pirin family protein [Candidatus Poseidoniaceae archaeon]MDP7001818.1 pirin family protein [Candidatus Poseidoniaceae archaeon]
MVERQVSRILPTEQKLEGGGFPVRRPFPIVGMSHIDPFLLLDEMGPVDWAPHAAIGAPEHPHRGFETVTYVLQGEMEHRDSSGNFGKLSPGDVQWMTAGSGIIHSELPSEEFLRTGGVMHGFQLWVNLPAKDKMMAPRYQDIHSSDIPEVDSDDGLVQARVIAGQCMGVSAVIDTVIPITYLHLTFKRGAEMRQNIDAGQNCVLYCFSGTIKVDEIEICDGEMAVLSDGDEVVIAHSGEGVAEFLLLSGEPTNESVSRYGPFVMNTQREIMQAINDFQNGTLVA